MKTTDVYFLETRHNTVIRAPASCASVWRGPDYAELPCKEGQARYRAQHVESLRKSLRPGQDVYCLMRHCSASGMSRTYDVYAIVNGDLHRLTDSAAVVGAFRTDKNGRIVVSGYGFSGSHEIVSAIGRALWPDGTPEPHSVRNGSPDRSGDYALKVRDL